MDSKPAEIADLFRQTVPDGTYEKATAADDFNTPVIVLIVIAAVLLIALIISTVLIARAYKRYSQDSLFRNLSKLLFSKLITAVENGTRGLIFFEKYSFLFSYTNNVFENHLPIVKG